ncbi:MAG TPA: hypothetical protein VKE41_04850 [Roseiflexaceae bacterium]|nr:hypothetical protein [Roseiflexaceae bacterium]
MGESTVPVVLAATHHDPEGRLYAQTVRVLPELVRRFSAIAIQATHASQQRSLDLLIGAGAHVQREQAPESSSLILLGRARRDALELGLSLNAPAILFCDFDRALHWAECYPEELADVVAQISAHDFTVLGRTERAFVSHPRIQRDTEAIVNTVYATVSGWAWDVTAAARGISRRAAAAILEGCGEESIGTDVAWPLFLQRQGGFTLGYRAIEGLEFETADRYGDQIAAAGGLDAWMRRLDADPRRWAERLDVARVEVAAAAPYLE